MVLFQIIVSISSMVLQSSIYNNVCKKELTTGEHINKFNLLSYLVCVVLFAICLIGGEISLYTVALGAVFGIATTLCWLYMMLAYSSGPMNLTLLIITSSMIIPAVSGPFFGEPFSLGKLIASIVLLFFVYLSIGKVKETKIEKKWYLYAFLAFVANGSIGILQKIHQTSAHREESSAFLLAAFLVSAFYSAFKSRKSFTKIPFGKKQMILAFACGALIFAVNFLNLRLLGVLPSQFFFPIINGSATILGFVASWVIFKERMTKTQIVGICGGFLSLMAICVL